MDNNKKKFTVDFNDVHYYLELHKAIKEGMKFPDYYGENLDALWDCLTDMIDNDVEIYLKNYQYVESADKDYSEKLLTVFHDAKHYDDDSYVGARVFVERDGKVEELD